MELVYSMRRKPLKCEPPCLDSSRCSTPLTLCTVSSLNVIAFTSLTQLEDGAGRSWGCHVYVCHISTPWDTVKVASTVYKVTALEWDLEGARLAVGTCAGELFLYGQKDRDSRENGERRLANSWHCLHSFTLSGEVVVSVGWFHPGRRVRCDGDKPVILRHAPTMRGFGGVGMCGVVVVTGSGLVGWAAWGEESPPAPAPTAPSTPALNTHSLCTTRQLLLCASIAYNKSEIMIAWGGMAGGVRACTLSVASNSAAAGNATHIGNTGGTGNTALSTITPLPSFYLPRQLPVQRVAWTSQDEPDSLLVTSGGHVYLYKMADRSLPVHSLLAKASGNTTPGGGQKPECFNTIWWVQVCATGPESALGGATCAIPAGALTLVVHAHSTLRALHAHTLHEVSRATVATSGDGDEENGSLAPTATPPKQPRTHVLPKGSEGAWVCEARASPGAGVILLIDSHSQLHLYRLTHPYCDKRPGGGVGGGAGGVTSALSQLQQRLCSGCDVTDLVFALPTHLLEPLHDRFRDWFLAQPANFQQYYYMNWLSLRIELYRNMGASGCLRCGEVSLVRAAAAACACVEACVRMRTSDTAIPTASAPGSATSGASATAERSAYDILAAAVDELDSLDKVVQVLEAKEVSVESGGGAATRRLQLLIDTAAPLAHAHGHAHAYALPYAHAHHQLGGGSGDAGASELANALTAVRRCVAAWRMRRGNAAHAAHLAHVYRALHAGTAGAPGAPGARVVLPPALAPPPPFLLHHHAPVLLEYGVRRELQPQLECAGAEPHLAHARSGARWTLVQSN